MKELKKELKLLDTLTGEESYAKFKEIADYYTRPEKKQKSTHIWKVRWMVSSLK